MKRVTRDRHLTSEEAAKYQSVREKIEEEKPEINARILARMAEKRKASIRAEVTGGFSAEMRPHDERSSGGLDPT